MLTALLMLACPAPKLQNDSSFPWNEADRRMQAYAQRRCPELYPEAPCLTLFEKHGKVDYSVLCGEKR